MELQSPYLLITSGFLAFASVNFLTRFITPRAACQTVKQKWKWRNVATSLVHSVVTGIWAPICFMQEPDMHTDLIRNFTGSSHALGKSHQQKLLPRGEIIIYVLLEIYWFSKFENLY